MSEYKLGRVYKIVCKTNPNIVYIGSTFETIGIRWSRHKSTYKRWMNGYTHGTSLYQYVLSEDGWENFDIVLIKEYMCVRNSSIDWKHLRAYEQLYINKVKCVNINSSIPLPKALMKNYKTEWYNKNKEKICEQKKDYYNENKEKILKQKKAKVTCQKCGGIVTKSYLSNHQKTAKCIRLSKN